MENGIEKKEPVKKPFFVKQPRRGRNVFGKYDPSRYEPDSKFVSSFSKVKTPVPTVPPPEPTPIRTSCQSSRSKFSSVSDVGLSRRGEAKSRFLPDNGSDVFGSAGRRPRLAQPVQEGRKGRYQRNV